MSSSVSFAKPRLAASAHVLSTKPIARGSLVPSASCYFRVPRPVIRLRRSKVPSDFSSRCDPAQQPTAGDGYNTGQSQMNKAHRQRRSYAYPRDMFWEAGRLNQLLNDLYHDFSVPSARDLFKEFESLEPRRTNGDWRLAADVAEDTHAYTIRVDVPGISKEKIKLRVTEEQMLVLSAERRMETDDAADGQDGKWRTMERRYGKFTRTFKIPKNVDTSGINAEVKDGVLTVTLPKIQEQPEEREKEIVIS